MRVRSAQWLIHSTGAARKLRDEVRRLIRLHLTAVWLVALLLGVAGAALVQAILFEPETGGIVGPIFAWSTLILLLFAASAGWRRAFGRRPVDRLVRENLLLANPRHRQELEAWLSDELVGSSADLVRRLLEVRLDRGLARRPWVPLRRSHFAGMALVLAACLALGLLYPLLGLQPGKSLRGYLRALSGGDGGEPPVITGLSPTGRWVRAGDLAGLEIAFDRDPPGAPKLLARSEEKSGSHDLERIAPARYRAALSGYRGQVTLQVAVGGRRSPELVFRVYPEPPVEVTEARWFDGRGMELGSFSGNAGPVVVPEGATVSFRIQAARCPLASIGLGAKNGGELELKRTGPETFLAETRLLGDESFQTFWQIPGAPAQLGSELAFQVQPVPVPVPRLVSPREGETAGESGIRVSCRSSYGGKLARGFVLASDYLGLQWTWERPVERGADGEWSLEFDLPLDRLELGRSPVLGICAVIEAEGTLPKRGATPVVNVLLPRSLRLDLAGSPAARTESARAADGRPEGRPGASGETSLRRLGGTSPRRPGKGGIYYLPKDRARDASGEGKEASEQEPSGRKNESRLAKASLERPPRPGSCAACGGGT